MRRLFFLVPVFILPLFPSVGGADGGALRLREQKGNYQIAVFTEPTPPRVGLIDISVLVQDAAGEVIDVPVVIKVTGSGYSVEHPATKEAAANKLYRAALFDLPEAGWYRVEVSVGGERTTVSFGLEAAGALPSWLALAPWVGWPLLAVLLFGVHQVLVRRQTWKKSFLARLDGGCKHATHR